MPTQRHALSNTPNEKVCRNCLCKINPFCNRSDQLTKKRHARLSKIKSANLREGFQQRLQQQQLLSINARSLCINCANMSAFLVSPKPKMKVQGKTTTPENPIDQNPLFEQEKKNMLVYSVCNSRHSHSLSPCNP